MDHEKAKLHAACCRMTTLANGLVVKFGPMDGSGLLIGAGLNVLIQHLGVDGTRKYLESLLAEYNADAVGEGKIPEA